MDQIVSTALRIIEPSPLVTVIPPQATSDDRSRRVTPLDERGVLGVASMEISLGSHDVHAENAAPGGT
jgi:hypothetical protein